MQAFFDNQLLTKYISAFGTIFSNITVGKFNVDHTVEYERIKVPIIHSSKEKYLARLNTQKKTQQTLPAIGYEIVGMNAIPERNRNPLERLVNPDRNSNVDSVYVGVPYSLQFEVTVGARNLNDAFQIVEQILPNFHPSLTIKIKPIPDLNFVDDVVVNLDSVSPMIDYEGEFDTFRAVMFVLSFSMTVNFFGAVSKRAIITQAFSNVFIDQTMTTGGAFIRINLGAGNNGTFNMEDVAYQGNSPDDATATGIVVKYDPLNSYIQLGAVRGTFRANANVKAVSSNASFIAQSFDGGPYKVLSMSTRPDPVTAQPEDNYGYTEEFIEYPDTI